MSQKTEKIILGRIRCEKAPQVVRAWTTVTTMTTMTKKNKKTTMTTMTTVTTMATKTTMTTETETETLRDLMI